MSYKLTFATVIGIALVCLSLSISTLAQVAGGTISGTVLDPSGGAVPGAAVKILNPATGVARALTTNDSGFFNAPNLLPGNYQVTTSASGFATVVDNLEVKVGQETQLNIQLKVGDVTEQVLVESAGPQIDQTTSALNATIEGKTIRELPLNGRDWTQLATLEPGVHTVDTQVAVPLGQTDRANRGWGTQLTVGGARPQQNNYRVDGISINDYGGSGPGNTLGATLGVEAIQEYSVVSANPSGEYGRTSGGVFNAITRSGTNAFHGSAFDFLRNSRLDAANFFDNQTGTSKPPFKRNQFGFSIGGPVYLPRFGEGGPVIGYKGKNKTFFFFDYEGWRESLSTSNPIFVPSTAARAGHLADGSTVTVDPKVRPYLSLFPLPNVSDIGDIGTSSTVQKTVSTENFYTIRVDHKISEADSMHGTFMNDTGETIGPDALNILQQGNFSKRKLVTLEETHIFNAGLLNTARFGYSRAAVQAPKLVDILNPIATDPTLGFLPGHPVGVIVVGGLTRFSGVLASGSNFFYNSFQGYDDLFYTRGNHAFKFGVAYEHDQLAESTASSPNGQYSFGSLRNFLTNVPTSFTTDIPNLVVNPTYLRQSMFGAYAQDDWRARSNLTLNLGLRYEVATLPTEKYNRLSALANLTDAAPKLGSPYYKNPTLLNFSPRLGFAWDPFKNGRTAVRGGFGLYDTLPLLYQFEIITLLTAPYFRTSLVNNPGRGSFPTGALQLLTPRADRVSYVEQNPKRSYVLQWNLNVQREFLKDWVLQVGYTGSHGVHLPFRTQDADTVLPTATPNGLFWQTPINSGTRINENFGQIGALVWQASSFYNALNARLTRRTQHGQLGASYTWAKSIDTNSASGSGGQFDNSVGGLLLQFVNLWRGLSDFDVRHVLVLNYVWEIPNPTSEHALVKTLFGGWQVGGIYKASSGTPFTPVIAGDVLGQKKGQAFDFPDRLNTPACSNPVNPGNPDHYIKTECFVAPTPINRLGNSGRNIAIGPGIQNFDLSLVKNTFIPRFSENFRVQFRAEAFNVFNHANFRTPTGAAAQVFLSNLTSNPTAGKLTATSTTSRQIQLAVKLLW
jgi:outer membrane receptor protein involved in Fe transport